MPVLYPDFFTSNSRNTFVSIMSSREEASVQELSVFVFQKKINVYLLSTHIVKPFICTRQCERCSHSPF